MDVDAIKLLNSINKGQIKQLITLLFLATLQLTFLNTRLFGQQSDSLSTEIQIPSEKKPVQIDFMASYYNQDGNHSAVTGGEGSEDLNDYASTIKINIPLKKNKELRFDNKISHFTSASTDNIDPTTISAASRHDTHIEINANIIKKVVGKRNFDYNISLGGANEAHFASFNGGFGFRKAIEKSQSEIGVKTHFIMDAWGPYYNLSRLYPNDYYGTGDSPQNNRYTFQTALYYNQIINEKLQASITLDIIQQFGLLSTPYNRIYFSDQINIDIERLPSYKMRIPVSSRLNYYAANWLIIRSSYRFYWDSFELKAHTASLELPLKINRFFSLYPFYRYHIQYGNKYFEKKGDHISTNTYYTSDYDVSDLQSHFIGGGFKWIPFRKTKKRTTSRLNMKSVEMRAGYYRRNDDFHSWIISGGFSFNVLRKEETGK